MVLRIASLAQTLLTRILLRTEEERGATAVEYAIMLAFIAAVIVFAVAVLGQGTNRGFQSVVFP